MQRQRSNKIAIMQFRQEANWFSTTLTTKEIFETHGIHYGDDIHTKPAAQEELAGFIKGVRELGGNKYETYPVVYASSPSGGLVAREFYDYITETILEGLRAEKENICGVFIVMHGAMGAVGITDADGTLLEKIRAAMGPKVVIGATFDLHANITQKKIDNLDWLFGYRTNPHREHLELGYSAAELMLRQLNGEVRPVMAYRKMRMFAGPGNPQDNTPPMNELFSRMRAWEKEGTVLTASIFMLNRWTNEPEAGWSSVVVTDADKAAAAKYADHMADFSWEQRYFPSPRQYSTVDEAIERIKTANIDQRTSSIFVCDSADAVGAGTPGENTWLLKGFFEQIPDTVVYLPLRDAEAAAKAFSHAIGDTVQVTVGGKLDTVFNKPYDFTGILSFKRKTRLGKSAILVNRGMHLLLTELPDPTQRKEYFTELFDLDLYKADVVVVKNLYPFLTWFKEFIGLAIFADTPGLSSHTLANYTFDRIPRPIFPFDDIKDWR